MSDSPMTDAPLTQPSLDELRAEALAGGRRPRRFGSWYAAEHMVRAMRAYGWTIVVGALGQPILYLLGLGFGLAVLLQGSIDVDGRQVPYLVFIAPALLATAAIGIATEELTYPVISGFKWRRYFYGFNASPLSSPQITDGVILSAGARMLIGAGAYYVFIWIFGAVPLPATGWLSIPVGLLAGLSFGLPLMAYSASIEDDKGQVPLVQRFVFMPMFLFSGTFYPLSNLPEWLQWIGWISPLWHASELGRMLTYGPVDALPALGHLTYLLLLAVAGYLWARHVFTRRLAR